MLTGDVGRMAELARDDRLDDASLALFHPLKFMLASPAEDAAEILQPPRRRRSGSRTSTTASAPSSIAHGDDVRLYSRDLHESATSSRRSSTAPATSAGTASSTARSSPGATATVLPFIALQARLGRKSPSAAIRAEVPVIFVAFDVLGLGAGADDGRGRVRPPTRSSATLREPLEERRRQLEALDLPLAADGGVFALSHLVSVDSVDGARGRVPRARANGATRA